MTWSVPSAQHAPAKRDPPPTCMMLLDEPGRRHKGAAALCSPGRAVSCLPCVPCCVMFAMCAVLCHVCCVPYCAMCAMQCHECYVPCCAMCAVCHAVPCVLCAMLCYVCHAVPCVPCCIMCAMLCHATRTAGAASCCRGQVQAGSRDPVCSQPCRGDGGGSCPGTVERPAVPWQLPRHCSASGNNGWLPGDVL